MATRKVLVIVNAARRDAGPSENILDSIKSKLSSCGIPFQLEVSSSPEDADKCFKQLRDGDFTEVWIGGGDGSVNQAIHYLISAPWALGIIPMGTINALARALDIPTDPIDAVDYLCNAKAVPMDAGQIEDRFFACYATVGLHAAIFHNINNALKKRWGKLAFYESAIRTLWHKSQLPKFTLTFDSLGNHGQSSNPPRRVSETGYSFILTNVANYAGFGILLEDRKPFCSGYFELHHFRKNLLKPMIKWFARLKFWNRKSSNSADGMVLHRLAECFVRSKRKLSVQIDGEPVFLKDSRTLHFKCIKGGLNILLRPTVTSE